MTKKPSSAPGTESPLARWPSCPQRPSDEGNTYRVSWGRIVVQSVVDETNIQITFDPSALEARRRALAFARALIEQVQEQRPGIRAEFVASGDHYQVRFRDFGSAELRAAHSLQASLQVAFARGSRQKTKS